MILSKRAEADRFLAKPAPGVRAALIYGRDRGGVHERADGLSKKIAKSLDDPFEVTLLSDADIVQDLGCAAAALDEIHISLVRLNLSSDKNSIERIVADVLTAHAEAGNSTFFLIEAGALERSSPLRKAGEKLDACAVIPVYEDEAGDVSRLVREALAADGVGLTNEALELFVARLPKERGVARQEIERLILYLGPKSGAQASAADLEPYLGVEPEASLADAAQDAFGGRVGPAQAALRRARAEGEGGPAAVRALGFHLGRLKRALIAQEGGQGAQQAAKSVGVFWKNEREFLRQLRAWRLEALEGLQVEVLDADRACKQTGSPDDLISERLALSIAGRARRLGL